MFACQVNGRRIKFETLALASKFASEVFSKTWIIIGIEKVN